MFYWGGRRRGRGRQRVLLSVDTAMALGGSWRLLATSCGGLHVTRCPLGSGDPSGFWASVCNEGGMKRCGPKKSNDKSNEQPSS